MLMRSRGQGVETEKRQQHWCALKHFTHLFDWGKSLGFPYDPSHQPRQNTRAVLHSNTLGRRPNASSCLITFQPNIRLIRFTFCGKASSWIDTFFNMSRPAIPVLAGGNNQYRLTSTGASRLEVFLEESYHSKR